ncbi:MAG: OmpA family protein [Proteobacteria bacterium]|nr:OmpA family protein [Pseudomonadota bacterium]MBU1585283.1 OmpA family protein [Pseudomonadota bacterium]MBU2455281.1 OmpA family protein [Pseudomonadota bacterium]MBU2627249.1 OmpA family protein [Pseudomonadota bacterium]
MRIGKLKWILLAISMVYLTSCASGNKVNMVPDRMVNDLTPAFEAGDFGSKVDGFVVLMDASSSMAERYQGYIKFDIAKAFIQQMNNTMPPISAVSGLRTIGHATQLSQERTKLFYGMTPYHRDQLDKGLAAVIPAGGPTPLSSGIAAIAGDLGKINGKKAVIIVSDGKDLGDQPLIAAQEIQAMMKDDLCIYTVLVGDDEKGKILMDKIAQVSPCGYMILAQDISSPEPMADYVSGVFLSKIEKTVQVPEAKTEVGLGYHKPEPLLKDLGKIHFNFDSAKLSKEGQKMLDQHIKALMDNPEVKIVIEGHSSASGTEQYNQALSEKRASAVKNYIVTVGKINSERLSIIGYGEKKPAEMESNPEDKFSETAKANMRVIFEVIDK